MKIHRLNYEDTEEYELFAIYTFHEDYRLAFLLNQKLGIKFRKYNLKENYSKHELFFLFEYYDQKLDISWDLIQNKVTVLKKIQEKESLFSDTLLDIYTNTYYLPELKKADYFIKITSDENELYTPKIEELTNSIDGVLASRVSNFQKKNNNILKI